MVDQDQQTAGGSANEPDTTATVPSKLEAVRLAREKLGEASAYDLAAYIEAAFGLKIQPAIVTVLLASLRERETLEQSRRKRREEIERTRAEPAATEQAEAKKQRKRKTTRQPDAVPSSPLQGAG